MYVVIGIAECRNMQIHGWKWMNAQVHCRAAVYPLHSAHGWGSTWGLGHRLQASGQARLWEPWALLLLILQRYHRGEQRLWIHSCLKERKRGGNVGQGPTQGFPGSSADKESTCNAGDPGSIPGSERSPGEGVSYLLQYSWAPLVAQPVKNLPAMRETWVGKIPYSGRVSRQQEENGKLIKKFSVYTSLNAAAKKEPRATLPYVWRVREGLKKTENDDWVVLMGGQGVQRRGNGMDKQAGG